jgi:hypothetical protein
MELEDHSGAVPKKTVRSEPMEARRRKAFEDYWALGPNRSINALFRRYKEIAKTEGPEAVPSLSMDQLRRWARQDDWARRALERDRRVYYKAQVEIEEGRAGAFKALGQYVTYALRVLELILTGEERASARDRLAAAKLVLELAGIKAQGNEEQDKAEEPPKLPPPPGPDASIEDFEEYYRKLLQIGKES